MSKVSAEEVYEVLLRVARGVVTPRLVDHTCGWDSWNEVPFLVDGWRIVVFVDCDDWDYVDSAVAPDGRRGDFDDWPDNDPGDLISQRHDAELLDNLHHAFRRATE